VARSSVLETASLQEHLTGRSSVAIPLGFPPSAIAIMGTLVVAANGPSGLVALDLLTAGEDGQ
jgi:hypothetical protein